MGVTVHMNGTWYYFEDVEDLEEVLNLNCNDCGYETDKKFLLELESEE